MSAIVASKSADVFQFALNSELSAIRLKEEFGRRGRLRVRDFLQPASANVLYQHLVRDISWRTFVVADERLLATPPGEVVGEGIDASEILDCAYTGARKGLAYLFDADRPALEDLEIAAPEPDIRLSVGIAAFAEFLVSAPAVTLLSEVTGISTIDRISVYANRFRAGHFMMFHSGHPSSDRSGKCRASFYVTLTPEWRPEWGGKLEFRTDEADIVESYVPVFGSLDVIAFPQGHWITPVAPFAGGSMLAIAGRIYAS